ncbi:type II secretion system protein [Tautonia marina]|uniref:type II secretion system protein n=1 Tax=Tautonia marina TaxID=2653855 RepID=UPI001375AA1B|nr:prepilin-type N-terminal cleavage/methylation domain-containing protein [Tautonia marina]
MYATPRECRRGFTLIELSIILVVIGLLAGAILVGRDMIANARIRSQIGQLEELESAIYAFRNKYRAYPGDMSNTLAVRSGLRTRNTHFADVGNTFNDNRQFFGATHIYNTFDSGCGEVMMLWADLYVARVLRSQASNFKSSSPDERCVPNTTSEATLARYWPRAELPGSFVHVLGGVSSPPSIAWSAGRTWFALAGIYQITGGGGAFLIDYKITAQEAYSLDSKIDDSRPHSGFVQTVVETVNAGTDRIAYRATGATECALNASRYNTTYTTPSCIPVIAIRSLPF